MLDFILSNGFYMFSETDFKTTPFEQYLLFRFF